MSSQAWCFDAGFARVWWSSHGVGCNKRLQLLLRMLHGISFHPSMDSSNLGAVAA